MQKLLTLISKNIRVYANFNDQSFNNMLTNNIISFEQLRSDYYYFLGHLYSFMGDNSVKIVFALKGVYSIGNWIILNLC